VIISNKSDRFIRLILKNHGLLKHFREILGGDTASCLKPDPCMLKRLMEKYHVPPRRALFIGDMTIDIETGKNAGVLTCGLTYGFDGREKLKRMAPDFLVDDLMELIEFIA
jgi:phosphoglycolate phosphatase